MPAKMDLSGPIGIIRNRLATLTTAVESHGEAADIVIEATEAAAQEIRAEYGDHAVTGTLANRVRVRYPSPLIGKVVSTAPHGSIFERGTKERFSQSGASRGRSPAHRVIATVAPAHRARMVARHADMLRRHGLTVTGA